MDDKTPNCIIPRDTSKRKWKPMMCPVCKTKLFSRFSGHYVVCPCPNKAMVDQTNHYERSGAMNEDLFPVPWEENDEQQD